MLGSGLPVLALCVTGTTQYGLGGLMIKKITILKNSNGQYWFRVTATNVVGTSVASTPSPAVVPSASVTAQPE